MRPKTALKVIDSNSLTPLPIGPKLNQKLRGETGFWSFKDISIAQLKQKLEPIFNILRRSLARVKMRMYTNREKKQQRSKSRQKAKKMKKNKTKQNKEERSMGEI